MNNAERNARDWLDRAKFSSDAWVLHPETVVGQSVVVDLLSEIEQLRQERNHLGGVPISDKLADEMWKRTEKAKRGEERIVDFSIFQDVICNSGNGCTLNGVPISDEEADKLWEQSPDNPKNKKG